MNEYYEVVNDLLKFLLCELKENGISISNFRIQKTVFKIKKELGEDHPLYEYLPFYWYNHGPFSEVVANQFNELKNNHCDQYSSKTFILNKDSLNKFSKESTDLINDYPIIKKTSQEILKDKNDFLNKFDESIYIDYAPFSFIHPFKYNIFEPSRDEDFIFGDCDEYLDIFYDCLSNLPYDNLLNDFSILFSRLFSRLELINDENQFYNCWDCINRSIQQSWYTFARWLSIHNHDTFYNENTRKWKIDLEKKVKSFNESVNYVENRTNHILNNSSQVNYTPFEDKIYKATIGNYLME